MPIHLLGDARATCNTIHIGLINNMPDGALKATERQFLSLLDSAADGATVHLSLYALPEVPRSESAREHLNRYYSGMESLWDRHLDGLIVTGTEPRTQNLTDEPYWESLAKVIEWAGYHTHSTVWSCLAAHAALLHTDGIGRRRFAEKRFGVFNCARASEHPLTSGLCAPLRIPHSRWNDIPESELADCGYNVLTRFVDGGVDSFAQQRKSLFVFFQGHPEYESNTLLLEYRRDIGRYLRRESDTYPAMPEGYFDRATADKFAALQDRSLTNRSPELLAAFPASAETRIENTWQSASAQVYGNWIAYLRAQNHRQARWRTRRKYVQRAREAVLTLPLPRAEVK
jgi:homoserine O-succinyltransferase